MAGATSVPEFYEKDVGPMRFEFTFSGAIVEDLHHKFRLHLFKDKSFLIVDVGSRNFRTESQILENVTTFLHREAFIHDARHMMDMEASVRIQLAVKPPREQRKTPLYNDERVIIGEVSIPVWVLASGPTDHNLPIKDANDEQVARLRVSIGFEQRAHVAVIFEAIECRDLQAQKRGYANPTLDISYSKNTFTNPKLTVQATKQKHILSPAWNHLQPLRFEATYKEMITEWIDVNVQHHSKFDGYQSIGRCKLILKAILNDDALVRFDGPITRGPQTTGHIKGVATFKYLPVFAQMVGGVHTEFGIFGGTQLLPAFLRPKFADKEGHMKRVGETEADASKLIPRTAAKNDANAPNPELPTDSDNGVSPAARERRGRARTEMPSPAGLTGPVPAAASLANVARDAQAAAADAKASSALSPLARNAAAAADADDSAAAADSGSDSGDERHAPVAAAAAAAGSGVKQKRGRAQTAMPAPAAAPKTSADFARDLFDIFTPTMQQTTTTMAPDQLRMQQQIAGAAPINAVPSGPSQSFVSFGDNPFASSPFAVMSTSSASPALTPLASPALTRASDPAALAGGSPSPVMGNGAAGTPNPFLLALATSSPAAIATPTPATMSSPAPAAQATAADPFAGLSGAAFNPFATTSNPGASAGSGISPANAAAAAMAKQQQKRGRSQTDTVVVQQQQPQQQAPSAGLLDLDFL